MPRPSVTQRRTEKPLVRSMTGYGRAMLEGRPRITVEVRAVNNRFLKLNIKLPSRYSALEERVKTLLAEEGVRRGSVDINLYVEGNSSEEGSFGFDPVALRHYVAQARSIARQLKLKGDVSLDALLPLPGVVQKEQSVEDLDVVWARARKVLVAAVREFNQMREREGLAMVADLRQLLTHLAEHRAAIETAAPEVLRTAIARFKERIGKLLDQSGTGAQLNNEALEREVVLSADRMDISEELARLNSHFEQMDAALSDGGEVGKKLDFLTQELFRETNTIGSKAQDERITHRVVEMKGLIEKIREQVQNLE